MKNVSTAYLDQIKFNSPEVKSVGINFKGSISIAVLTYFTLLWSTEEQSRLSIIVPSITVGVSFHEKKNYIFKYSLLYNLF